MQALLKLLFIDVSGLQLYYYYLLFIFQNGKFFLELLPIETTPIIVDETYKAFALVSSLFNKNLSSNNIISEMSFINDDASIGSNVQIDPFSTIKGNCNIGNNVIIANNVPLGGHVIVEDSVVIGGNSAVQQFTRIGRLAMIGGMTGVLKDVIPFGLSIGNRNHLQGLNLIGLRRKNYENKKIMELNKA